MKRKVFVVGAFGFSNNQYDGQTIKTQNVYRLLKENYDGPVARFDTLEVKKRKNFLALIPFLWNLMIAKTVIIVPADHSLAKLFPILFRFSKIFRYDLIHLCVGGWQVEYFVGGEVWQPHLQIMEQNRLIKAILPQVYQVDRDLREKYGFTNSEYFPNFRFVDVKPLNRTNKNDLLRIVYMARVKKEKGYDVLLDLARIIKQKHINASIDFYGQIDPLDEQDFLNGVNENRDVVKYNGALNPKEIYKTLSTYDILILPTKYYTEGFPGSILDAFLSGVPVIVSRWKHAYDFVADGKSGFIVDLDNPLPEIENYVQKLCNDRDLLKYMKEEAVKEGGKYTDKAAWDILSKYL